MQHSTNLRDTLHGVPRRRRRDQEVTGADRAVTGVGPDLYDSGHQHRYPERCALFPVDRTGGLRWNLTDRELDVLRGLVAGRGYKGTAGSLGIGVETVRSHIKSIYGKLQVHSVAEAVAVAIRRRLV